MAAPWPRGGFQEGSEHRQYLSLNAVAPGYFETLGTPLLAGREFAFQDAGRPHVAIVNEAMARRYFASRTPLGQHVTFDSDSHDYEIVGVVADAKVDLRQAAPATVYLNAFQNGQIGSQFILRTDVAPLSVVEPVRRAVQDVVSSVRVERIATLAGQIDEFLVLERTIATLSGLFGALGVMLAAMGLFFAAAMIEGLPVNSPFPIAFALLAMRAVALGTAYVPARRAARVRPIEALRHE